MEWMLMPLKKYADFSGRSRRKEYWMFYLFSILCVFGIIALLAVVGSVSETLSGLLGFVAIIFYIGLLIPSIAVGVRRLHDTDKSGWMMLIGLIPFGGIVLLVFFCMEGTRGPNQYGPDPKDENSGDIFA
jgi:uncharacterized membrane protein YhaH (DUF805 family)